MLMGEVARPGPYPLAPGSRVADVIAAAGGTTKDAAIYDIGVVRQQGPKPAVTHVDFAKFYKQGDVAQNIPIQSGDVVYVPPKSGVNWGSILSSASGIAIILNLLK